MRRAPKKKGAAPESLERSGQNAALLKKLRAQLDAVCAKLPSQNEARAACAGVFKAGTSGAKV